MARQIDNEIHDWATRNFPNTDRVVSALGLAEEVGEFCRAVLKQKQGIRGSYAAWDDEIKRELGDIYIKLAQIAGLCNWNLQDLIAARWDEISQRDWIKDPTGHGLPT